MVGTTLEFMALSIDKRAAELVLVLDKLINSQHRRSMTKASRMVQPDTIQETRLYAPRRRARRTRLAGLLTAMVRMENDSLQMSRAVTGLDIRLVKVLEQPEQLPTRMSVRPLARRILIRLALVLVLSQLLQAPLGQHIQVSDTESATRQAHTTNNRRAQTQQVLQAHTPAVRPPQDPFREPTPPQPAPAELAVAQQAQASAPAKRTSCSESCNKPAGCSSATTR